MLEISKEQLYARLDIMPQELKDALFSSDLADLAWDICQNEHLSEEKSTIVAQLAGDALMGFVHREDLEKEIEKEAAIDIKIARDVYSQLDKKIFAPLRERMDAIYSPVAILRPQPNIGDAALVEESPYNSAGAPAMVVESEADIVNLKDAPQEIAREFSFGAQPSANNPKGQNISATEEAKAAGGVQESEISPLILHKMEEPGAVKQQRASLGGLFGLFRKNTSANEKRQAEESGVMANIITSGPAREANKAIKQTMPEFKIVNYSSGAPKNENQIASGIYAARPNEAEEFTAASVRPDPPKQELNITPKTISFGVNDFSKMPQLETQSRANSINTQNPAISQAKEISGQNSAAPRAVNMDISQKPKIENTNQGRSVEMPNSAAIAQNEISVQNKIPNPDNVGLNDIPVKDDVIDLRNI